MIYFIQGLTMGLAYVAPIGLQNLFVINTALTQPRKRAYLTALIVIFFDATLALACFFGIGAVMEASKWLELGVLFVGSLIVIWIGISLLKAKNTLDTSAEVNVPIAKVITTACVVTWFNPQALIDGSMMLGAFKATIPEDQSAGFIIGVICASCVWFLGISTIISFFSAKITDKVLRIINIVCGIVIIFYGIKLGIGFVKLLMQIM
ncbi:MAG: LysE family transporter [Eubacteriales bacterium]|nr:LysE family transporter [Eubacteriales bacterium]